ncbi:hypothetical protein [Gemmatimonas sp.]
MLVGTGITRDVEESRSTKPYAKGRPPAEYERGWITGPYNAPPIAP